ncbi:MAG: type I-C CRISPR-associated protein Cas5c [Clostridiales bacterium]|nr:type I-C CRISPR-associated protein Cas5c [Clostridiales bacterium]
MGVVIEVSGPYALFSRPELKVERVSYDIITPSAARGLLESVYWHPGVRWKIDKIHVMNPIRFVNIRRNEISAKLSAANALIAMKGSNTPLYISAQAAIQQRASLLLRDVRYVIEAHFDVTANAAPDDSTDKFYAIIMRRLQKGQCFLQPYLGCREFPADVCAVKQPIGKAAYEGERDLGFMLYDMDYANPEDIKPRFFRAVLRDGVLNLSGVEVFQ